MDDKNLDAALNSLSDWIDQRGLDVVVRPKFLVVGSSDIDNPLLNEWRAEDAKRQARRNRNKLRRKKR